MRKSAFLFLLLIVAAVAAALQWNSSAAAMFDQPAITSAAIVPTIDRLDPALDALLPPSPTLVELANGYKWTEGPVWLPTGHLLFAEIPSNSIREWTPGDGVSIFMQPSGYKGSTPYCGPEPGSNGMTLDSKGRLTVAGHAQRDVWRLESLDPHGQVTVLADTYQGKRLNSPNDLVYRSDGSLYFTDPPYGLCTQNEQDLAKELPFAGVYRIPGALNQKPGSPPDRASLQLLVKDLPRPNGIALSPDEKYLYVNNSEPEMFWMRYTVNPDGSLKDPKRFFDAGPHGHNGAPDGMKVDQQGNIYSAGPGGVFIFSPEGKHLGTIKFSDPVGNLTFGGPDGKTLYITASDKVYSLQVKVAGIYPHAH
ncbi:MAG: SMP-30/gluconolactonase/LRE family protein [Silvibacterium sp.]|nr:SMP-30/gluconolactonase/LRE family protein [Silvibacterium sp.]MBV8437441.1 SMP-30/gluconolactonase/LRE family protein [Silvibacterium sp.]